MDLYETVLALFCDPEGKVCCAGSDGDRAVLQASLDAHISSTNTTELEKVRDALEFYHISWLVKPFTPHNPEYRPNKDLLNDNGNRAKEALTIINRILGKGE